MTTHKSPPNPLPCGCRVAGTLLLLSQENDLHVKLCPLHQAAAELLAALEAYDPSTPPALAGETDAQYTDRLTGADGGNPPYLEHRNRQCSIGYHSECSDPEGERCKCPCHQFEALRDAAIAKAQLEKTTHESGLSGRPGRS